MRRDPTVIRDEINRAAEQRASVYRALAERPAAADLISPARAELDKRLGWLWEELREAQSPRGIRPAVWA